MSDDTIETTYVKSSAEFKCEAIDGPTDDVKNLVVTFTMTNLPNELVKIIFEQINEGGDRFGNEVTKAILSNLANDGIVQNVHDDILRSVH